jgi:hypothetical protein
MYLYVHVYLRIYSSTLVHNLIYMYIHVCTMYRALYTDLHILVHVVRIPDDLKDITTGKYHHTSKILFAIPLSLVLPHGPPSGRLPLTRAGI